jgi:hypothetical protein
MLFHVGAAFTLQQLSDARRKLFQTTAVWTTWAANQLSYHHAGTYAPAGLAAHDHQRHTCTRLTGCRMVIHFTAPELLAPVPAAWVDDPRLADDAVAQCVFTVSHVHAGHNHSLQALGPVPWTRAQFAANEWETVLLLSKCNAGVAAMRQYIVKYTPYRFVKDTLLYNTQQSVHAGFGRHELLSVQQHLHTLQRERPSILCEQQVENGILVRMLVTTRELLFAGSKWGSMAQLDASYNTASAFKRSWVMTFKSPFGGTMCLAYAWTADGESIDATNWISTTINTLLQRESLPKLEHIISVLFTDGAVAFEEALLRARLLQGRCTLHMAANRLSLPQVVRTLIKAPLNQLMYHEHEDEQAWTDGFHAMEEAVTSLHASLLPSHKQFFNLSKVTKFFRDSLFHSRRTWAYYYLCQVHGVLTLGQHTTSNVEGINGAVAHHVVSNSSSVHAIDAFLTHTDIAWGKLCVQLHDQQVSTPLSSTTDMHAVQRAAPTATSTCWSLMLAQYQVARRTHYDITFAAAHAHDEVVAIVTTRSSGKRRVVCIPHSYDGDETWRMKPCGHRPRGCTCTCGGTSAFHLMCRHVMVVTLHLFGAYIVPGLVGKRWSVDTVRDVLHFTHSVGARSTSAVAAPADAVAQPMTVCSPRALFIPSPSLSASSKQKVLEQLLTMTKFVQNQTAAHLPGSDDGAWKSMAMHANTMVAVSRKMHNDPPSSMGVQSGPGRKRSSGGNSNINIVVGKKSKRKH